MPPACGPLLTSQRGSLYSCGMDDGTNPNYNRAFHWALRAIALGVILYGVVWGLITLAGR